MNPSKNLHSRALRLNVLAAALALALPLGASAQAAATQPTPRWNRPTTSVAPDTLLLREGRNQPRRANGWVPDQNRTNATDHVAAVVPVTSCADDGGPGTLRSVLVGANDGDTVDLTALTCSVITLQSGFIEFGAQDLTIVGPGRDQLTVDGNGGPMLFSVPPSLDGPTLTVSDLTLTNGVYNYGGCLYVGGGDLVLNNVTITDCHGNGQHNYGGAVDAKRGLTMNNSIISNSSAIGDTVLGGGAYVGRNLTMANGSVIANSSAVSDSVDAGALAVGGGAFVLRNLVMQDSLVSGNLAQAAGGEAYGGGIGIFGKRDQTLQTGHVTNSVVTGNSAVSTSGWSYGGGINAGLNGYNSSLEFRPVALVISGSTIADNAVRSDCETCTIMGGGLRATHTITIAHSTVSGNRAAVGLDTSATAYGGGLATRSTIDGTITLSESTVSNNAAMGRAGTTGGHGMGGGVASPLGVVASPVIVANSTLAFNQASDTGGAVLITGAPGTRFDSSIVANNWAEHTAGIAAIAATTNSPSVTILGDHNLIWTASNNVQLPGDTLVADPQLRALAANGGPTATHALRATSPAIDAGSNPNADSCDQRNGNYMRVVGVGPDIGAFEVQTTGLPVPFDRIFQDNFDPVACQ